MYKKYIKRVLDVLISLIFIIILIPFYIVTYIITKIEFKGSAIFKQYRIGLNEKPYKIYKFKTMSDDTKKTTRISNFIRKIGLDEIPQFINVLLGDMSIIGPRPFIVNEPLPIPYSKLRHTVRPGLTGLAQVSGRYTLTHKRKLELDDEYVSKLNFILDLKIFFKTIVYILKEIF